MDDVIIVGAGPAGNNAALGLANQGHSVTVIDWRHNIGDKPCTGIVGRECIWRFPIDPSLIYGETSSASLVSPESHCVHLEAKSARACIINRVAYVASFAQRARAAGARYCLGQRVLQVLPDEHGVTVIADQSTHRARSLILASGFGSPLTRQLGLGSAPDHVSGIQALVASTDITNVEIYLGQEVAPGFFSWVVPTSPGQALVGLLTRRKAPAHMVKFLHQLRKEERITRVLKEPACWGIPLRPLKRTYRDRVLVVGDAAGQVKPITGGGIYYSLLASELAAAVLHQALKEDNLSAGNLGRYQNAWKDLLSHELETGYSARRFYEYLSDQQINSLIRQAGASGVYEDLANAPDTSFDWHSQMIGKVMTHPAIHGVLRLLNPLLTRLAPASDAPLGLMLSASSVAEPVSGASQKG